MTKYLILSISIICFGILKPIYLEAQCYVQDCSGNVNYYENLDPSTVNAQEWQVRLFDKGQSTSGRWRGLIIGETSSAVMARLTFYQNVEKLYGENYSANGETSFNPLGPIAISKCAGTKSAHRDESLTQKILIASSKIVELRNNFLKIKKIIDNKGSQSNPFKSTGSVFREYCKNLLDV